MTLFFFALCVVTLFIHFKNKWFNVLKIVISLAITLNGIDSVMNYSRKMSAEIYAGFVSNGPINSDQRGMMNICFDTVADLEKVSYYIPAVMCIILGYVMIRVLIRRVKKPYSSELTVKMTVIIMLLLPFYCCVAYGLGLNNPMYNMIPVMLKLALILSEIMILPLMTFSFMCEEAKNYFSENTMSMYR